jgi:hypothetical protein
MPRIGSYADMESTWKLYPLANEAGEQIGAGDILVSQENELPSPHAIYIGQPANLTVPTHYHDNAQFQLFVEGGATLGRRNLRPVTVHFATHQTGYGPLVSGPQGLVYITLRLVTEFGAHYPDRPEERARMNPAIPRRQITQEVGSIAPGELQELKEPQVIPALGPEPGGLAAWVVRLAPGATLPAPVHPGGAGQFYTVTAGSLVVDGRQCERHAVVWVGPQEEHFSLCAGTDGAEVVVCQFPRDALCRAGDFGASKPLQ